MLVEEPFEHNFQSDAEGDVSNFKIVFVNIGLTSIEFKVTANLLSRNCMPFAFCSTFGSKIEIEIEFMATALTHT